jgi:hypothetical protein
MKRKTRLEQSWDKVKFLAGSGLFLDFPQNRLRQFRRRCDHRGKQPPISHLRNQPSMRRYLQALLTKSEIELKLNQCKIQ